MDSRLADRDDGYAFVRWTSVRFRCTELAEPVLNLDGKTRQVSGLAAASPAPSCSAYRPGPGCGRGAGDTSRGTEREAARPVRNPRFPPPAHRRLLSEGIAPVDSPWKPRRRWCAARCRVRIAEAPVGSNIAPFKPGPSCVSHPSPTAPLAVWGIGTVDEAWKTLPAVSGGVAHPVAHRASCLLRTGAVDEAWTTPSGVVPHGGLGWHSRPLDNLVCYFAPRWRLVAHPGTCAGSISPIRCQPVSRSPSAPGPGIVRSSTTRRLNGAMFRSVGASASRTGVSMEGTTFRRVRGRTRQNGMATE